MIKCPPLELSDSKEEAAPETDLTLAWPKKKKNSQEREKGDAKEEGLNTIIKEQSSLVCLDKSAPPRVFVLNPIWGNTVCIGLGVCSNWGFWNAGGSRASRSWKIWIPCIG